MKKVIISLHFYSKIYEEPRAYLIKSEMRCNYCVYTHTRICIYIYINVCVCACMCRYVYLYITERIVCSSTRCSIDCKYLIEILLIIKLIVEGKYGLPCLHTLDDFVFYMVVTLCRRELSYERNCTAFTNYYY